MNDPISKWMSPAPYTISAEASLMQARRRMEQHGIRHLPVLEGGALVGVISDRDLKLFSDVHDLNETDIPVREAMSTDVLSFGPETKVASVAAKMNVRKCGSAVVMKGREVVGIFTTVDALALIANLGGSVGKVGARKRAAPVA